MSKSKGVRRKAHFVNIQQLDRRILESYRPQSVFRYEAHDRENKKHRRVRRIKGQIILLEAQADYADFPKVRVQSCRHHDYPVRIHEIRIIFDHFHPESVRATFFKFEEPVVFYTHESCAAIISLGFRLEMRIGWT